MNLASRTLILQRTQWLANLESGYISTSMEPVQFVYVSSKYGLRCILNMI
jgi:hypothetical protein